MKPEDDAAQLLELFGIAHAGRLASHSPIDGAIIGRRIGCSMCRLTNGAAIVRCAGALLLSKPSTG